MKKLIMMVAALIFTGPVWADIDMSGLLNKVNLQLKAEKWVTTQTAEVSVAVNASVTDQGIEKVQNYVLSKLNQLSNNGEWHIISYTRAKDKSDLESIQIIAQARLAQSELAGLRTKAKSISKPGETYSIDNIQFTPSDDELRQAKNDLRKMIYDQVKGEIETINNIYPTQKFYIHNIDFTDSPVIMPMAEATVYRSGKNMLAVGATSLKVGNKLDLFANVTLAAMPDPLAKKSPLIN